MEAVRPQKPSGLDDPSLAAPLGETIAQVPRLQYIHSYSFFFESPHWPMNLLLLTVSFLIPIVGPIVMAGYQIEIINALHRSPAKHYPDFEFNRFGDYLSRGIWKFLVDMLSQFVMMPVYMFLYVVGIITIIGVGSAFSPNPQNPGPAMGIAAAIVVPIAMAIALVLLVAIQIVTTPVVLKASLSGDAGALFDLRFLFDFLRRTWREMLLEMVWLFVTTPVVALFGLLLFFVGIYPAMALVQMADAHTSWQLYEIYLAKGGEPITLKTAKPAPVILVPIEETEPYPASVSPHNAPASMNETLTSNADDPPSQPHIFN